MIVQKFGGTSVKDAGCFAGVADIISGQRDVKKSVIVVSAMSGVTDQLIAGARFAAEGNTDAYQQVRSGLARRHRDVVDALLGGTQEAARLNDLIEERLGALERFYSSIAVLGELTARGNDAVVCFGEQLSANVLASVLRRHGGRVEVVVQHDVVNA